MTDVSNIFPNKINISGAPEGMDAQYLVQKVVSEDRPIVHIARNDTRALVLRKTINFFDPSISVIEFPAWDCLPYDLVSPNKRILLLFLI